MEGIYLMGVSTVIYFGASGCFAYRGQWLFAGVQLFYALANCCLIGAAWRAQSK